MFDLRYAQQSSEESGCVRAKYCRKRLTVSIAALQGPDVNAIKEKWCNVIRITQWRIEVQDVQECDATENDKKDQS
jgi:hypothetical protein